MLNYQLAGIERLVDTALRRQLTSQEEFQSLILNDLNAEVIRISGDFMQVSCSTSTPEVLKRNIQTHQHKLIFLMDSIVESLPPAQRRIVNQTGPYFQWFDSYKYIYVSLENLLIFIEQHFGGISYSTPLYALIADPENITEIRQGLESQGIEEEYVSILTAPLQNLITIKAIPYQRLLFLHELKDGLNGLINKPENIAHKLFDLLVYLNFNDTRYYQYVTGLIERDLDEIPGITNKLNQLYWIQKRINQAAIKPGFSFIASEPSLKEQLQLWLKEEISYISISAQPEEQQIAKVKFDLSVHQLGYFLNLLVEQGIITNEVKKEVAKVCAQFMSSTKQENIAYHSLLNKFSEASPSVVKSVRDMLLDLVNATHDRDSNSKR